MRNDYGIRHQHKKGSFEKKSPSSGGGKRHLGGKTGSTNVSANHTHLDNMKINKKGQPLTKHV